MEVRDKAKKDWQNGMKYQEIADKYGISLSAVKSWATRYWKNDKVATKTTKKVATNKKKKVATGKRGAPAGNKNSAGTLKTSQPHNQNNYKHGIYANVYWDTLDDDERGMIEDMKYDEEEKLLQEQLQLFSVRERRLMQSIKKYKEIKGGLAVAGVIRAEHKREFESEIDKKLYDERIRIDVVKGKRLPGKDYSVTTTTESTADIIYRLEQELTKVQKAKTKVIDSLMRLRLENRKLDNESKGNDMVDDWIAAMMGEVPEGGEE